MQTNSNQLENNVKDLALVVNSISENLPTLNAKYSSVENKLDYMDSKLAELMGDANFKPQYLKTENDSGEVIDYTKNMNLVAMEKPVQYKLTEQDLKLLKVEYLNDDVKKRLIEDTYTTDFTPRQHCKFIYAAYAASSEELAVCNDAFARRFNLSANELAYFKNSGYSRRLMLPTYLDALYCGVKRNPLSDLIKTEITTELKYKRDIWDLPDEDPRKVYAESMYDPCVDCPKGMQVDFSEDVLNETIALKGWGVYTCLNHLKMRSIKPEDYSLKNPIINFVARAYHLSRLAMEGAFLTLILDNLATKLSSTSIGSIPYQIRDVVYTIIQRWGSAHVIMHPELFARLTSIVNTNGATLTPIVEFLTLGKQTPDFNQNAVNIITSLNVPKPQFVTGSNDSILADGSFVAYVGNMDNIATKYVNEDFLITSQQVNSMWCSGLEAGSIFTFHPNCDGAGYQIKAAEEPKVIV